MLFWASPSFLPAFCFQLRPVPMSCSSAALSHHPPFPRVTPKGQRCLNPCRRSPGFQQGVHRAGWGWGRAQRAELSSYAPV